jgi:hypothetical protein
MFQYTQTRLFSSFSAPTSPSSHTPTDPRADTRLPSPQETPSHHAQTPSDPCTDPPLPIRLTTTSHHAQTPSDLCTDPTLPIRLTTTSHHAQTPSDPCTDPPLPSIPETLSHLERSYLGRTHQPHNLIFWHLNLFEKCDSNVLSDAFFHRSALYS